MKGWGFSNKISRREFTEGLFLGLAMINKSTLNDFSVRKFSLLLTSTFKDIRDLAEEYKLELMFDMIPDIYGYSNTASEMPELAVEYRIATMEPPYFNVLKIRIDKTDAEKRLSTTIGGKEFYCFAAQLFINAYSKK